MTGPDSCRPDGLLAGYFTARFCLLLAFVLPLGLYAQDRVREVNHQSQFWWSVNTTARVSSHWSLVGDVHILRNRFLRDPSFYFLRVGAQYMLPQRVYLTAGYAHMWIAPSRSDWQNFVNENRIYQQGIYVAQTGKVNLLQRIRNEQRWQQEIIDDKPSGNWRFTNRVRYLINATIPLWDDPKKPRLVLADELLVHFGKPIVYNTFDQNRIFLGIRQSISPALSFDFGYMNVYQQKFSGFQYDMNHTLRLFFYWAPDWRAGRQPRMAEPVELPD